MKKLIKRHQDGGELTDDILSKYGFKYVPISAIYKQLNDDELNYNMSGENIPLSEYYKKYPNAKVAINNNGRIVTANMLKELQQRAVLQQTQDWNPDKWLSQRAPNISGPQYTEQDVKELNSHIPEYKAIEIASKANGSWLKMPDGSTWNGDPRIWIMMQSEPFTKNYAQEVWYTGQGEWPTIFNYENTDVPTDKAIRAPYFDGNLWFSNSRKYGDMFSYYWDSDGMHWRKNREPEKDIGGYTFIAARPKVGNFRKLTPPEPNSFDLWEYMPYKLSGNSIERLQTNQITKKEVMPNLYKNRRIGKDKLTTDRIVEWSKELGDDGVFLYHVFDGPVFLNPTAPNPELAQPYTVTTNKVVNEFISQPGFTKKMKFIPGNNGKFDPDNPYKYSYNIKEPELLKESIT